MRERNTERSGATSRPRRAGLAVLALAVLQLWWSGGPSDAVPRPATTKSDTQAAIIGGEVAGPEWGNVVLVQSTAGRCSGVMLSTEWVLTAGHCTEPVVMVTGGANSRDAFAWTDYRAVGFTHPQFRASTSPFDTSSFDVGLVRLSAPQPPWGRTLVLPTAQEAALATVAGTPVTALGWGVTTTNGIGSNVLKSAAMTIESPTACDGGIDDFEPSSQACAKASTGFTCSGDSGGPMVAAQADRFVVLGIVSYGNTRCDGFSYFATYGAAADWIGQTMAATPSIYRLAGATRYDTAALLAQPYVCCGGTIYVMTGANFPDSLAGGPVAIKEGAALLLVELDRIPDATRVQLEWGGPDRIVVLGGPAAVSEAVVAELAAYAPVVERRAGPTRYETAVEAVRAVFAPGVDAVWIAAGTSFVDGMIAGAAAAHDRDPMLLVDPTGVPATVADELRRLQTSRVIVVGDAATVPDAVLQQLSDLVPDVRVVRDADPSDRSVQVWANASGAPQVLLTTSLNFPDGLAGGWFGAIAPGAALFVVPGTCLPLSVQLGIIHHQPRLIGILGGPAALSPAIDSLAGCP